MPISEHGAKERREAIKKIQALPQDKKDLDHWHSMLRKAGGFLLEGMFVGTRQDEDWDKAFLKYEEKSIAYNGDVTMHNESVVRLCSSRMCEKACRDLDAKDYTGVDALRTLHRGKLELEMERGGLLDDKAELQKIAREISRRITQENPADAEKCEFHKMSQSHMQAKKRHNAKCETHNNTVSGMQARAKDHQGEHTIEGIAELATRRKIGRGDDSEPSALVVFPFAPPLSSVRSHRSSNRHSKTVCNPIRKMGGTPEKSIVPADGPAHLPVHPWMA